MPHDRDNKLLEVGDFVNIPCVVKHIHEGLLGCNVELETVEGMPPDDNKSSITLNTKQVEKK